MLAIIRLGLNHWGALARVQLMRSLLMWNVAVVGIGYGYRTIDVAVQHSGGSPTTAISRSQMDSSFVLGLHIRRKRFVRDWPFVSTPEALRPGLLDWDCAPGPCAP